MLNYLKNHIYIAVCSIALSSCSLVNQYELKPVETRYETNNSAPLLQALLADTTVISHSDGNRGGHGTQLEYHSADGNSYLWYPRNQGIVFGRWRAQKDANSNPQICYMYGQDTFNPVLMTRGGNWECQPANSLSSRQDERVKGDPFNLSSGDIPFIIPNRDYYSTQELYETFGGSTENLDFVTDLQALN